MQGDKGHRGTVPRSHGPGSQPRPPPVKAGGRATIRPANHDPGTSGMVRGKDEDRGRGGHGPCGEGHRALLFRGQQESGRRLPLALPGRGGIGSCKRQHALGPAVTEHAGLGVARRAGRRLQSSAERRIRPAVGRGRPRRTPSARRALAKERKEGLRPGWFLFVPKIKGGRKGRVWGQGKKAQGAARAGSPAGARGRRAEPIGTGPSRQAPPPRGPRRLLPPRGQPSTPAMEGDTAQTQHPNTAAPLPTWGPLPPRGPWRPGSPAGPPPRPASGNHRDSLSGSCFAVRCSLPRPKISESEDTPSRFSPTPPCAADCAARRPAGWQRG